MDLVISDIHADISALNTIMDLVNSVDFKNNYGEISRILNLGDVLERGTSPKEVLEKFNCKLTELPLIFVNDPAIVGLGVKPGDMIKITRKSSTAGESLYYRYVVEV